MENTEYAQWYVMRDLKRCNAKKPAYKQLQEAGVKVFVPLKWQIILQRVKGTWESSGHSRFALCLWFPSAFGLHCGKNQNASIPLVAEYVPGTYDCVWFGMDRFIQAVSSSDSPKYYLPEEITPQMCGRKIRIIGGSLNGYEGCLLKIRGSKIKRLLVELKGYLAVAVEVLPEYIQFVWYDIYDCCFECNGQSQCLLGCQFLICIRLERILCRRLDFTNLVDIIS